MVAVRCQGRCLRAERERSGAQPARERGSFPKRRLVRLPSGCHRARAQSTYTVLTTDNTYGRRQKNPTPRTSRDRRGGRQPPHTQSSLACSIIRYHPTTQVLSLGARLMQLARDPRSGRRRRAHAGRVADYVRTRARVRVRSGCV